MALPLEPPLPPMLAKLARELPAGPYLFEPKFDGFRCLVFRDGDSVELQSRHGNALGRYFPELLAAVPSLAESRLVLDGEIVAPQAPFEALMLRLHPAASRVELLARETPTVFVAFDLLAEGDRSLLEVRFGERRARLERLFSSARTPLHLAPATGEEGEARRWLDRFEGVMAKQLDAPYRPGKRELLKVKRDHTADCVVAGFRLRANGTLPSSLLLGLWDERGALEHVGVAASFGAGQAESILAELRPRLTALAGHPWEHGFLVEGGAAGRLRGSAGRWVPGMTMDWVPVAPELVAEVAYDQVDAGRLRHPARFRRWRPDRDPRSCGFEQLEEAERPPLAQLLR
jgi:ATP-dependent DNA ligase